MGAVLLLAVVAATGLLAMPSTTAEVRAATPNLTIVTSARYDVQPEARRVRVTVDMTLVNLPPGTYELLCFFPGPDGSPHAAHGMMASFEVTAPEGGTPTS